METYIYSLMDFTKKLNECGKEELAITKQNTPFHAIVQTNVVMKGKRYHPIWEDFQFYIELEEGRDTPSKPLTRALKLKLVKYNEKVERSEVLAFKMANFEEVILMRDRLNVAIDSWKEYVLKLEKSDRAGDLTNDEKFMISVLKAKREVEKDEHQD